MLIYSLEGLQQNPSLGTKPIDNAAPYYTHGNTVC